MTEVLYENCFINNYYFSHRRLDDFKNKELVPSRKTDKLVSMSDNENKSGKPIWTGMAACRPFSPFYISQWDITSNKVHKSHNEWTDEWMNGREKPPHSTWHFHLPLPFPSPRGTNPAHNGRNEQIPFDTFDLNTRRISMRMESFGHLELTQVRVLGYDLTLPIYL